MQASKTSRFPNNGFTLIEVTLVVSVLLSLISALFVGLEAYKRGSDRALCIQNIARMQRAVRSYSNLNQKRAGESVTGLQGQIVGADKFFDTAPICPAEGNYSYGGDIIPMAGVLYLACDIADHIPVTYSSW